MYTDSQVKDKLKRFLRGEINTVLFYVNNLDELNYRTNKKRVDKLVLESVEHIAMMTKLLLSLEEGTKRKATKKLKEACSREEISLQHIYAYTAERTDNPRVEKVMQQLVKMEKEHEKLVKGLR